MKLKILSLVAILFLCQACSNTGNSNPKAGNKPTESQPSASTHEDGELPEIKDGDNINQILSQITVKDRKLKSKNLGSLVSNKESLLVLVKPGCVFCESMMAVIDATRPKIKPKLIFALDQLHATEDDFKAKLKKHSSIKATWVYDHENKLHDDLGLTSFPRLIHMDAKQNVITHQIGLILPEDRTDLESIPFPVALQKISEATVSWMKNL